MKPIRLPLDLASIGSIGVALIIVLTVAPAAALDRLDLMTIRAIVAGGSLAPIETPPPEPTKRDEWPDRADIDKEPIFAPEPEPTLKDLAEEEELPQLIVEEKEDENLRLKEMIFRSGYIDDDFKYLGRIVETQNREIRRESAYKSIVYSDYGYQDGARPGMLMTIVGRHHRVRAPGLWIFGGSLGRLISVDGVARVESVDRRISKLEILKSYNPIDVGSYLIEYVPPTIPDYDPDKPLPTSKLTGYIVDADPQAELLSSGDIAHIDLGSEDGVGFGDVFFILNKDDDVLKNDNYREIFPKVRARARVMKAQKRSSAALIYKAVESVKRGDFVIAAPER